MAEFPKAFGSVTSPAIATYPARDLAEGTGVIPFFGYQHKEDTTAGYALSDQAFYVGTKSLIDTTAGGTFLEVQDLDFDVKFNLVQNMTGIATANITFGAESGSNAAESYCIIKIRHWDGSTETDIAQAQTETLAVPNGSAAWVSANVIIDLSAITHFRAGETLRVTLGHWVRRTGGSNRTNMEVHIDPQQTDTPTGADMSFFKVHIPFRIDL